MGLRPLFFHVDAGWNTDQAVGNIEKLVNGLNSDLYTEVANWDQVKRMQVAFLRSGIPDQDLVQDAVFFSELYKFARFLSKLSNSTFCVFKIFTRYKLSIILCIFLAANLEKLNESSIAFLP